MVAPKSESAETVTVSGYRSNNMIGEDDGEGTAKAVTDTKKTSEVRERSDPTFSDRFHFIIYDHKPDIVLNVSVCDNSKTMQRTIGTVALKVQEVITRFVKTQLTFVNLNQKFHIILYCALLRSLTVLVVL